MARRPWIKTHCDRWLRGTIRAESPSVRAALHDLNVMGGDSAYGDLGRVQLAPDVGLTDEGFAAVLNFTVEQWREAIARLQPKWIRVYPLKVGYGIELLHWRLQSDYNRQKPYRLRKRLQPKLRGKLQPGLRARYGGEVEGEVEGEGEGEGEGEQTAINQLGSSPEEVRAVNPVDKGPTDPIEKARSSRHPMKALLEGLADAKAMSKAFDGELGDQGPSKSLPEGAN